MPVFSATPPPQGRSAGIDLVRTPANRPFIAIVTSEDLVGCPTHFYRNRTTPCEGENCQMCGEGYSWKWHGYLSCIDQATHDHVMFEMTANGSDPFRAYRKQYGTLRGCLFKATRHANRYNGRVSIRCQPADLGDRTLRKGANLVAMLCHIWNIPVPQAEIIGRSKDHPRIRVHEPAGDNGKSKVPS